MNPTPECKTDIITPASPPDPVKAAEEIVNSTGINLFLTGKAGTGKTTFLHNLANSTSKRFVVLAPTGVAAINAGGNTIHSFFQLSFAPFIPGAAVSDSNKSFRRMTKHKLKLIRTLDLIIIDEISMVRPDLLDAVDDVLRRLRNPLKPFGGVQLLLIGDLRQLAPVMPDDEWALLRQHYNSPYFFESQALRKAGFLMIELTKVYRQSDPVFLDILNKIRDNNADEQTLALLNTRADMSIMPKPEEGVIRLTSHNYRANAINNKHLNDLDTPVFTYEAAIQGNFPESSYPADTSLQLKLGAQVMFIKNDITNEHRFYNGLIGHIVELDDTSVTVKAHTPAGEIIKVTSASWENLKYTLNPSGEIKEEVEGVFTQIPLRPAWAITIHKSQGLTFDRAIVDAAQSFAPGQTYVALSRCRSMEGLYLESPLPASAIMTDPSVNRFISSQPRMEGNDEELAAFKDSYYRELVMELFNFSTLDLAFDSYFRAAISALSSLYPIFISDLYEYKDTLNDKVIKVSDNFSRFLRNNLPIRSLPEVKDILCDKMRNAAAYYCDILSSISHFVADTPLEIDNQVLLKRLARDTEELLALLKLKIYILRHFKSHEFDPQEYLSAKTQAILQRDSKPSVTAAAKKVRTTSPKNTLPADISDPKLYRALQQWRKDRADGRPAYTVLNNKVLMEICRELPVNLSELKMVKGMGPVKLKEYGDEILDIISRTLSD